MTTDARRALPLFAEHEPDVVLLHLHMPHKNGFEVLREARPLRKRVPVHAAGLKQTGSYSIRMAQCLAGG